MTKINSGLPVSQGATSPYVLGLFKDLEKEHELPAFVEAFVERDEIYQDRFTPQVREAMIDFLVDRGIKIESADKPRFDAGEFDEHFALAYAHATALATGEADPIDSARQRGLSTTPAWDFSVETFETFEQQGIVKENILAAGAIDYIYELGERMGIFRLVDALVLNWASGAIDVVDGQAASKLYRYWKLRDERSTPEERGLLYRRVLDKGSTKVLTRMVANEHFRRLWHNLMSEVAEYITKSERIKDGKVVSSPISRTPIYRATKELQYNLTEYCTGMAHMQAHEVYAQLQEGFELLGDEEIVAHFGGKRRKSLWTVIESLSKSELGSSPNIAAVRSLAVDGNKVFQWAANFNETATSHDEFLDFIDAAESYILNSALVDDDLGDGASGEEDFEDDFEDDFGDDFEDDFGDDF